MRQILNNQSADIFLNPHKIHFFGSFHWWHCRPVCTTEQKKIYLYNNNILYYIYADKYTWTYTYICGHKLSFRIFSSYIFWSFLTLHHLWCFHVALVFICKWIQSCCGELGAPSARGVRVSTESMFPDGSSNTGSLYILFFSFLSSCSEHFAAHNLVPLRWHHRFRITNPNNPQITLWHYCLGWIQSPGMILMFACPRCDINLLSCLLSPLQRDPINSRPRSSCTHWNKSDISLELQLHSMNDQSSCPFKQQAHVILLGSWEKLGGERNKIHTISSFTGTQRGGGNGVINRFQNWHCRTRRNMMGKQREELRRNTRSDADPHSGPGRRLRGLSGRERELRKHEMKERGTEERHSAAFVCACVRLH